MEDFYCCQQWQSHQIFNFSLSVATTIECVFVGCAMIWWSWRLRNSKNFFFGFVITLIPVKFILASWTAGTAYDMYYDFGDPPYSTVIQRTSLFFAIMAQFAYVIYEAQRARKKDKSFILIVEDNETLARIYRRILEEAGYNSELATSGYDALTLMNYTLPDFILCDARLGDMTGTELVRKMRANGFDGKAIAISGTVIDPGEDYVASLLKPVTKDELLAAVRKHLA